MGERGQHDRRRSGGGGPGAGRGTPPPRVPRGGEGGRHGGTGGLRKRRRRGRGQPTARRQQRGHHQRHTPPRRNTTTPFPVLWCSGALSRSAPRRHVQPATRSRYTVSASRTTSDSLRCCGCAMAASHRPKQGGDGVAPPGGAACASSTAPSRGDPPSTDP